MSVNYKAKIVYGYRIPAERVCDMYDKFVELFIDREYGFANDSVWETDYFIAGIEVGSNDADYCIPTVIRQADFNIPYSQFKIIEDLMAEYFSDIHANSRPEYFLFVNVS